MARLNMYCTNIVMMNRQEFKISGYQLIEKTARNGGDSARVFVPKTWKDKRVALILLDSISSIE